MKILTTKLLSVIFSVLFITASVLAQNGTHEHENGMVHQHENEHEHEHNISEERIRFYKSIRNQLKSVEDEFLAFKKKQVATQFVNFIPVKIHVLQNSDATQGLNNSETEEVIHNLNDYFGGSNLEFFLCSEVNYINNDNLANVTNGAESALVNANNVRGVINIYFSHTIKSTTGESICGFSNNNRNKDYIFVKNSCSTGSTLAHEMGHFFSLFHTHGPYNDKMTTELVNGSNCDTDGDGICDTPADPKLSYNNVNTSCEYTGNLRDANGHTFRPNTENIMSYSRKECRSTFSPQQLARMYAFYVTQKNYLACQDFNADFEFSANQTCESSLTVDFRSNCDGITKWEWDMDSDGIIDYTTQNPSHTFDSGIYDITLVVHKKSKKISKTYHNLVKVGYYAEDLVDVNFNNFEIAGDNGWTSNDVNKSGYTWLINQGETATKSTGPIKDTSKQSVSGKYIYAEASGSNPGDIAEFISPCINVVYSNSEIQFSYHMFGKNIGELHVDIKTQSDYIIDVIDPIIGSQQKSQDANFLIENIDLSEYQGQTINLIFRAIRGNGYEGDIAIDDIFLKTISTPISNEPEVTLYPNPLKGNYLYIKTNLAEDNKSALTYEISNIVGQKFSSGIVSNRPIDTSDLSSGTYLLTLSTEHTRIIKRFIR